MTAISEPERRSEIFAAGLNSILVKPTRYADIAALLASLGTTDSERPEASANKAAPAAEAPEELVAGLEPLIGRAKAVDLIRRAFAEVPDDLLADTPDLPVTEALIDRLHMAAGVTGNVGFVTLSQELSRAERAARRGDAAKLAESRQRVSELVRNYKPDMEVL